MTETLSSKGKNNSLVKQDYKYRAECLRIFKPQNTESRREKMFLGTRELMSSKGKSLSFCLATPKADYLVLALWAKGRKTK